MNHILRWITDVIQIIKALCNPNFEAYERGLMAAKNRQSINTNPYEKNTLDAYFWSIGFENEREKNQMIVIHIEDGLVQGVYTDSEGYNGVPVVIAETTRHQDNDGDFYPSKTIGPFTVYSEPARFKPEVVEDIMNTPMRDKLFK